MTNSKNGAKLTPVDFRAELRRRITELDSKQAVSATRNQPLEELFETQLGYKVAVKSISSSKQIKNRFSEIRNRPDTPAHAVVLVATDIVPGTGGHARTFVAAPGGFTSVTIVQRTAAPEIAVVVHRKGFKPAKELQAAFPKVQFDEV